MRCKSWNKPMVKLKKGLWSPDEDQKLTYYVMNHGHGCWSSVPINAGLQRNGKSCRLRWINYLRPGLKRGGFSLFEEETILTLHGMLGNKWSQISQHLPGRTDNEIKNHWHSHLKKRVAKLERLQDHPKVADYKTSDIKCKEASLSCLNASNFTNSSSADMDQSVPPVSQISNLPKVLFADWISLDEFQQGFVNASGQPRINGLNYPLSKTEYERQYDEGSAENSEPQICQESGSNEAMQHTQMTIDEIFEFNNGDFYIDDIMYM